MLEKWKIVWSDGPKVRKMIELSKPITLSIPVKNISFLSETEWIPVGAMRSHPKPRHLSSSSPECPIRANVIAQIITCGRGVDFITVFTSCAQWRSNRNDSITPIRLDNDFDVGCFCLEFLIASCHRLPSSSFPRFLRAYLLLPLDTVGSPDFFMYYKLWSSIKQYVYQA